MRQHYPWLAGGLDYFEARLTQAPEDAKFAINYVYENANTRGQQELAIQALRDKCDILWAQLDALYFAYVQPGWPPAGRVSHRWRRKLAMAPPSDASQPRLAAGCRWGGTEQDRVILFPEGAIKLQGTGRQILERCDGTRTFGQLIDELQGEFGKTDPEKIRTDISAFLEQLQKKRIVDY